MANLVWIPFEDVQESFSDLSNQIAQKYLERDHLLYHVCERIMSAYILQCGLLEHQIIENEMAYYRSKRKYEMLVALHNRKQSVDIEEIEKTLDEEVIIFQKRLDASLSQIEQAANVSSQKTLSSEESQQLKKMYRQIMKQLHPDLNIQATQEDIDLYQSAVLAYENGDLKRIELIYFLVKDRQTGLDISKQPLEEVSRLQSILNSLQEEIDAIKNDFPYRYKEILEDENSLAEWIEHLQSTIKGFENGAKDYEQRIEQLIKNSK